MTSETENKAEGVIVITKGLLVNPDEPHREVWLNIPYGQDELWLAKESINVNGGATLPFSAYGGYLKSGECHIEFESMDELLDYLKELESAVSHAKFTSDKMQAILELERCSSISEARYLMGCADGFEFYSEADDAESLGKLLFQKRYGNGFVNDNEYYIDFETYGRDYINFHNFGCKVTSVGAIEMKEEFLLLESSKENEMTMS